MGLFDQLLEDGLSVRLHCSLPRRFLLYSLLNSLQLLTSPERIIKGYSNVMKEINQRLFGYQLLTFCFLLGKKKIEPAVCTGACVGY